MSWHNRVGLVRAYVGTGCWSVGNAGRCHTQDSYFLLRSSYVLPSGKHNRAIEQAGLESKSSNENVHNAEFLKRAAQGCRYHGWDQKVFTEATYGYPTSRNSRRRTVPRDLGGQLR